MTAPRTPANRALVPARLHPARIAARATRSSIFQAAVRPRSFLLGLLVLVIVGAAGFWARRSLQREVHGALEAELGTVLDTATHGLVGFLDACERLAGVVAVSPDVRAAVQPALGMASANMPAAPATPTIGRVLAPYLAAGQLTGFVLTDSRGVVLAAGGGLARVGERLPPAVLPIEATTNRRRPSAGLPFLDAEGHVRVVVAAPIREAAVFLGLAFDHRPFSASLLAARAGSTGETYAFDRRGLMISSSRFSNHLRGAGLLGPDDEDTALRVELRDPGGDLTTGFRAQARRRDQPLTFMAAAATAGRAGLSLTPYRDYRGVPVVGAWRWLPDRDLGIASEIDAEQAFQPLHALERVFAILLALLAAAGAAAVVGAAVAARARLRASRSEREARRVGGYVIERKLGAGAMGDVFLARHALLRRPTAVKLLRPDRTSAEGIERFEREVRVTATLSHPNTIAIYDYGRTEEGSFYYAMEFLDGIDLDSLVTNFGPLPEARIIHLLRQACGALGEGHDAGVVHRDVKLANLYLCTRGGIPDVLKVLDFGLVKAADAARVTSASVVVGTPENMAPELFESADNASVLTDIYALGCVGYALATARRPFEGSSIAELCNAHLGKSVTPPSRRLERAVDPWLERVILACLAKRPAERPQSTREIVELLERSPLARAWTKDDADAFWTAQRTRIDDIVIRRGERAAEAADGGSDGAPQISS